MWESGDSGHSRQWAWEWYGDVGVKESELWLRTARCNEYTTAAGGCVAGAMMSSSRVLGKEGDGKAGTLTSSEAQRAVGGSCER